MRVLRARDVLRESTLLDQLPPAAAARLRETAQVREYRRHEMIYHEGDLISGPAWVHWGLLRVYQTRADGRESTVAVAWPGELAIPSWSGRADWPVAAVAITPVIRVIVPEAALEEVCRRDPRVTMVFLRMLADDTYEQHRWCAALVSVPLRVRLPRILKRMADQLGTRTERGVLLDFPVVQEDIATIAHVTRDETGRVMREMLQEGVIDRLPGRRLVIPDPSRIDV